MDDEKPFELRDKLAVEILNGILSSEQGGDRVADIIYYVNCDDENGARRAVERMEKVICSCYRVADIMRKVRLSTFE